MAAYGLNESQARSVLVGVQHAAKLLRDCREIVAASAHPSPLHRYTGQLIPPNRRVAEDYLDRLHEQLLRFLDVLDVQPSSPATSATHALDVALLFFDNTLEEISPERLIGYGPVTPEADRVLRGELAELRARVREVRSFVTGASAEAVNAQLARLPPNEPLVEVLRGLDRIITTHGLLDLRPALSLIVERAAASSARPICCPMKISHGLKCSSEVS